MPRPGGYFVTLVTHRRECLFGQILDGEIVLNPFGEIVLEEWEQSPQIRQELDMDAFVVMPNHMHGIVFIRDMEKHDDVLGAHDVGAPGRAPLQQRQPRSLGAFIAGYKSVVTKRVNQIRGMQYIPLWQRNYYEHIIRNEIELKRMRRYILENPMRWDLDDENPQIKPFIRRLHLSRENRTGGKMPDYIEYEIEDGFTILVKAPEEEGGMVKAARGNGEPAIEKSEKKFSDALEGMRRSAIAIKRKLEGLRADEVEVKFGLVTTGKAGFFAVAELGVEANYEVTLKWKNTTQVEKK
ncbi:MAG: hypothetical protein MUO64_09305 [Anaerolineales bacterium]|nr:hypothetical protein [Anaerolineales bacterium]